MKFRHVPALVMAVFITWNPLRARTTALGVVVAANRVHLNTITVTEGATVYEGDRFSTETGGMLKLQSGTTTLELTEESTLSVRNVQTGSRSIEIELNKGTLTFGGSACPTNLEIVAKEARIHPSTEGRTFARISVMGNKKLHICARRGSLQFSYHGETKNIAEGESYLVLLDPPAKHVWPVQEPRAFLFVVVPEVAAIIGLAIHEAIESPDRP